jgi:hypothetical protein
VELARGAGRVESAAQHEAGAAVREVLYGNAREGRRAALSALCQSNGRDGEYGAALALAFSGDSSRARHLADDLWRGFPEDTAVRHSYLPVLGAAMALNRRPPHTPPSNSCRQPRPMTSLGRAAVRPASPGRFTRSISAAWPGWPHMHDQSTP